MQQNPPAYTQAPPTFIVQQAPSVQYVTVQQGVNGGNVHPQISVPGISIVYDRGMVMSKSPQTMQCPSCGNTVITKIRYETGLSS
jgi:LITAF-like zinc ribbon domain